MKRGTAEYNEKDKIFQDTKGASTNPISVTKSFKECLTLVKSKYPTANGISWFGPGNKSCVAVIGATYIAPRYDSSACLFEPGKIYN